MRATAQAIYWDFTIFFSWSIRLISSSSFWTTHSFRPSDMRPKEAKPNITVSISVIWARARARVRWQSPDTCAPGSHLLLPAFTMPPVHSILASPTSEAFPDSLVCPALPASATAGPHSEELDNKSVEERLQLAITEILRLGFKSGGRTVLSFNEAAKIYKVSKTTLIARFHGRETRVDAHKHERTLTPGEETVLVEWIKEKGCRNIPVQLASVAEHASTISNKDVSEAWVRKFRARHPELKSGWSTGMEQCRAGALNRPNVEHFFSVLESLIDQYQIKPENLYNMDEKGVQLGVGKRTKVLVDREQKDIGKLEDGNRELITIIECLCADGSALPPSVVYQGIRRDLEWGRVNPCDAR